MADSIHIKPKNRGKLHRRLGVPAGKKIPAGKLAEALRSADPGERREAQFAENAKGWN
jgi:hypothetical protein